MFKFGPRFNRPCLFLFMANEQHLALAHQGTAVWNNWRKRDPEAVPDLRMAGLSGVKLRQAKLCGADLREAWCSPILF
jgi:uncharacterized protein YjbI with pentapeptide repeats